MARFDRDGYAIADVVLSDTTCETIAGELPDVAARRGGVRDLISSGTVVRVITAPHFAKAVAEFVDGPLVAVKATLFDKTPHSNWAVQWHQDRQIAVKERIDVPGYRPWTLKSGVPHVEPPSHVLDAMVAVRIQLDASGPDNGPLRVIAGSHRRGTLSDEEIAHIAAGANEVRLAIPRGSILVMRPLLVHASAAATQPEHRRVLHIELAPPDLIRPLEWHDAVPLAFPKANDLHAQHS